MNPFTVVSNGLRNIQKCKLTLSPSLYAWDYLSFTFPVGYIFFINISVALFQFTNQITLWYFTGTEQTVFTDIVRQDCQ